MKRILKSGGDLEVFMSTCNFCGCVFEYTWGETIDLCCGRWIICPECGEEVSSARAKQVKKKKNG